MVYSTRFFLSRSGAAGTFLLGYTVPTGKRSVVRTVTVYNNSGGALNVYIEHRTGSTRTVLAKVSPATDTSVVFAPEGGIVLNAGDELGYSQNVANAAQVTASGYELDAL